MATLEPLAVPLGSGVAWCAVWESRLPGSEVPIYFLEHDALFASIRQGKPLNDGEWMATSSMLAIMGRMAAYTGQQITWEQALNSQERLFPDTLDWKGTVATPELARPGVTKFL